MPQVTREAAAKTRLLALLGAVLVYLIGTYHRFVWDIDYVCSQVHGQSFDPATSSGDAFFPISQRCNADYDLVPAFVNPTIVALTALAIVAAIVAWRTPPATPKPTDTPSGEVERK